GQAGRCQGQVRQENHTDLDDGAGHHHRLGRSGGAGSSRLMGAGAQRNEVMKKRREKQADLDRLKSALAKVSTGINTTLQGIKVDEDNKLRHQVQAADGKYNNIKNTL